MLQLKQIPGLESWPPVDDFFNALMLQSTEHDPERLKSLLIRISELWYRVLDPCPVRDRPRVIEILVSVWDYGGDRVFGAMGQIVRDAAVLAKRKRCGDNMGKKHPSLAGVNVNVFRDGVATIPGLMQKDGVAGLVNEICDLFELQFESMAKHEQ
ncbi:hypothetical protein HDU79_006798, partial [Rhizoclosmatium sp. JEL0117]